MKITLIGTAYPFRGGLALFNERLIKQLKDEGNEVNIYTFTTQYPSILFPGKTQYSKSAPSNDYPIKRILSSINPITLIHLGIKLKKEAPDLVLIKYWQPFFAPCFSQVMRIAKKNGETKFITIIDNMIPHERKVWDKFFMKLYVKYIDAFVAMSDKVLKDIDIFDKKKPRVLSPHPLFDTFGEAVDYSEAQKQLSF